MSIYHYHEIGFDCVRLFGGFSKIINEYGEGIEIMAMPLLHAQILEALCLCDIKLTGQMVFAMRTELELSQSDMGFALGLAGRQMLSLYERGEREMPLTTQQALKRMVLSKIAGSRISLGIFDRQLTAKSPELFDFEYGAFGWFWRNSPHDVAQSFELQQNDAFLMLADDVGEYSMNYTSGFCSDESSYSAVA